MLAERAGKNACQAPALNRTRQMVNCSAENIFGGRCHSVSSEPARVSTQYNFLKSLKKRLRQTHGELINRSWLYVCSSFQETGLKCVTGVFHGVVQKYGNETLPVEPDSDVLNMLQTATDKEISDIKDGQFARCCPTVSFVPCI